MSIEAFIDQGDKIRDIDIFFDECYEESGGVIHGFEMQRHNHQREGLVKALKSMGLEMVAKLVNLGLDTTSFHKALLLADGNPDAFALAWAELKAQLLAIMDRGEQSETPHPYKLYFAEYCKKNTDVRNNKTAAAKAYWATKLDKNERKEYTDENAFVRSFKYYLSK